MKRLLLLLLVVANLYPPVRGQNPVPQPASDIEIVRPSEWTRELTSGWKVREGDDPAFARPDFNDSGWQPVDMSDLGPAKPGWRWYRVRIKLPAQHPQLALLIEGGEGAYELYINGARIPEAKLLPTLRVRRPIERVYPLTQVPDDLTIA